MTHKQYKIDQTKKRIEISLIYDRCAYCKEKSQGRAHIIPQRLIKKYGWLVIDHWRNFQMTCNQHNSKAQLNTTDKAAINRHLVKILKTMVLELEHEKN